MTYLYNDSNQTKLSFQKLDYYIPNKHISRFIKKFITDNFDYLDKKYEKKLGRPAFPKTAILSIILYGQFDNYKNPKMIHKACEENIYYQYLTGGLIPSQRTIERFIKEHSPIFEKLANTLLEKTKERIDDEYNDVVINGYCIENPSKINADKAISILRNVNQVLVDDEDNTLIKDNYKDYVELAKILDKKSLDNDKKLDEIMKLESKIRKHPKKNITLHTLKLLMANHEKDERKIQYHKSGKRYDLKLIEKIDLTHPASDDKKIMDEFEKINTELYIKLCGYNLKQFYNLITNAKVDKTALEKFMKDIDQNENNLKIIVNIK